MNIFDGVNSTLPASQLARATTLRPRPRRLRRLPPRYCGNGALQHGHIFIVSR